MFYNHDFYSFLHMLERYMIFVSYHYIQFILEQESLDLSMSDLAKSAPTEFLMQPVMKPS